MNTLLCNRSIKVQETYRALDEILQWPPQTTIYKLRTVYVTMLSKQEVLKENKSEMTIIQFILYQKIETCTHANSNTVESRLSSLN